MQLEFLWRDAKTLEDELSDQTGLRLQVTVTDNTCSLLSMRRDRASGLVRLRVHRMFLGAGPQVMHALAAWLRQPRSRRARLLDDFIRQNGHQIRKRDAAPPRPQPKGRFFDLQAIYRELNWRFFGGRVDSAITWGRRPNRRPSRSIRFGSYSEELNLIRIHPLLDAEGVPGYFVRYIVFHEMLHAYLGVRSMPSGRRVIHSREFMQLEQTYPEYDRAVRWQSDRRNLRRFLR